MLVSSIFMETLQKGDLPLKKMNFPVAKLTSQRPLPARNEQHEATEDTDEQYEATETTDEQRLWKGLGAVLI